MLFALALRDAPASSLGYGDPRGRPELRQALAAYLARARGTVADPELIVVCAGFVHGLSLVSRVLHAQGVRRIAMEDPGLWWHRDVASAAGLHVVPLPVDEQGARTDLVGDSDAGAVLLAPAHQFPRGAVLHPDRRTAATAWARATAGLVIEDDYDAELRYDRQPVGALQALDPDHVAFVGTTSKTLAPGLRLGWLLVPHTLLEPVVALRLREDVHVPAPEQLAFSQLLVSGGSSAMSAECAPVIGLGGTGSSRCWPSVRPPPRRSGSRQDSAFCSGPRLRLPPPTS